MTCSKNFKKRYDLNIVTLYVQQHHQGVMRKEFYKIKLNNVSIDGGERERQRNHFLLSAAAIATTPPNRSLLHGAKI